ncbi:unnamed protein product, partial [Protopolystoma xenopodis]
MEAGVQLRLFLPRRFDQTPRRESNPKRISGSQAIGLMATGGVASTPLRPDDFHSSPSQTVCLASVPNPLPQMGPGIQTRHVLIWRVSKVAGTAELGRSRASLEETPQAGITSQMSLRAVGLWANVA